VILLLVGMTLPALKGDRLRVEIRKGFDPLAEKEQTRAAQTMAELADDYMEEAEDRKRASSIRNDRQMMDKIILPKLGALPVAAVTQRDLEGLNHSLKSTPYRANRVLALLSSMFSHAMKRKWRPDNPAKGIPRYHEDRRDRSRTATIWAWIGNPRAVLVAIRHRVGRLG